MSRASKEMERPVTSVWDTTREDRIVSGRRWMASASREETVRPPRMRGPEAFSTMASSPTPTTSHHCSDTSDRANQAGGRGH